MDQPPIGEHPPIPVGVIRELHQHYRERVADWAWQKLSTGTVAVFESYRARLS